VLQVSRGGFGLGDGILKENSKVSSELASRWMKARELGIGATGVRR